MRQRALRLSVPECAQGQLSLEFLMLFAIFMAALAVIASAVFNSKSSAQASLGRIILEKSVSDVVSTANELCILGDGNRRYIGLATTSNLSIITSGRTVVASDGKESATGSLNCDATDASISITRGSIVVENKENKIRISVA